MGGVSFFAQFVCSEIKHCWTFISIERLWFLKWNYWMAGLLMPAAGGLVHCATVPQNPPGHNALMRSSVVTGTFKTFSSVWYIFSSFFFAHARCHADERLWTLSLQSIFGTLHFFTEKLFQFRVTTEPCATLLLYFITANGSSYCFGFSWREVV